MQLFYILWFYLLVSCSTENDFYLSDIYQLLKTGLESKTLRDFLQSEFIKLLKRRTSDEIPLNVPDIIEHVSFNLYTRASPASVQVTPTVESLASAELNITKPLRVMTHGFWSSAHSDTSQDIKNAYLTYEDVNVILVDWKYNAHSLNYITTACNTKFIGKYLAVMLDAIFDYGVDPMSVHLIGHSLGAHISGFAGKYTKVKVARITGLDPAGPLFETLKLVPEHLSRGDALIVDIIHTSAGALGFKYPSGDIDFYPNDGTAPQPGCQNFLSSFGRLGAMADACSHGRSWKYFAASINPNERFKSNRCTYAFMGRFLCNTDYINYMGEYVNTNNFGVFHLVTNSEPPFSRD